MILAAGFGTRLLPHTRLRPKPLFPLLGRPLLLVIIERLQAIGCSRIVVNCHYLAEQIEAAVAGYGVIVQKEESVLGTGGGLRRAMQYFSDDPVLVVNGDIYHTIDMAALYQYHRQQGNRVTLAMHDFPRFNTVYCDGKRVCHFARQGANDENQLTKLAYTGVQVIDPQIVEGLCPDSFSCIINHYKNLLTEGEGLCCFRADGTPEFFWTDIGTPADYLALHGKILQGKAPCWPELQGGDTPFAVAGDVDLRGCAMRQWAVVGSGVRFGDGCSVTRSVLWDDVQIADGTELTDTLVSGVENG